jgi:diguanylate cyclase (GGDEF)-like protein
MKSWDIGDLPGLKKSIEAMEGLIGSELSGGLENCKSILGGIDEAACVLNDSGSVIYLNPAFEELSGEASRFTGKPFMLLLEEGEARSAAALLSRAVSGESLVAELALKDTAGRRSFRCFPLKDGSGLTHAVCLIGKSRAAAKELDELMEANRRLTEEIRESRNAESEKLVFLKNYDPVTGLFNRQHFIELLGSRLGAAEKGALLLIDIDQFKFISDSYGHGMGDEYLRRVARLLQFNVRYLSKRVLKDGKDEVLLSRLSGDEFALYLPAAGKVESVEAAERLRSAIECFYQSDMHCHMTASIGIALSPEHGTTATGLLTKADASLYRAKELGRNRFHLYSPEEREIEQMHMRLKWKENILSALKDSRFSPWYQPIIGLADNRVTHYEVLARMEAAVQAMDVGDPLSAAP